MNIVTLDRKLALCKLLLPAALGLVSALGQAQTAAFPLTSGAGKGPVIERAVQPLQPFTVAGPRGVIVGTQDGSFEAWVLPVKLLSHLSIEANIEGYSVPIEVNPQAATIEVRPDRTTITYSHIAFTLRQIMFSPSSVSSVEGVGSAAPSTGPVALFQIDCNHAMDLTFRFTPEMRWMWPKRNDGTPSPEWTSFPVPAGGQRVATAQEPGFYVLHMDYPGMAGAITIPTATPGILAPYQERPQVHPLELHLHYDPKRDGDRYFPLLMAVGTTPETATNDALGRSLQQLNAGIATAYQAQAAHYEKLLSKATTIHTPDKALDEAFRWGVASIEQLRTHEFASNQDALVAGYFASADSARPGFGWFFGRDALYTLYAVNGFGDFALTRDELEFLSSRQRADGKIMHEFAQTASDPAVGWKEFPYMYAAADATPLFLMAMRDYYRASGDVGFLKAHREVIEKAWAFEIDPAHDTDHDGIYDNSQGTGWVESWPHDKMPHQEVYLALLDEQASEAYAELAQQLASLESAAGSSAPAKTAKARAAKIAATIEQEYYDEEKGCYAFSHNFANDPNGATDRSTTIYPAIAYWDTGSSLAHVGACLQQWAGPTIATDWGERDVATTEGFYDGMSYHQGSVWPLFTGWGALAEYRAGQPLAGEQMLMQNVDLTWAQDPGAVTELLSGDYFVPFGRSTSHQLWSSAMVITPTLRGLFGISLDAGANTITVNPHLPAGWQHAEIDNIHLGGQSVDLVFSRVKGKLSVGAHTDKAGPGAIVPTLRSDVAGARISKASMKDFPLLEIPLPPLELVLPEHQLPTPGSRPSQAKILSTQYAPGRLTALISGVSNSTTTIVFQKNGSLPNLKIGDEFSRKNPGAQAHLGTVITLDGPPDPKHDGPESVAITFPEGQGWQTVEVTLTW